MSLVSASLRPVFAAVTLFLLISIPFATSFAANAAPTPRVKPPAPGPIYLTAMDEARLDSLIKAIKKRQYSAARAQIDTIDDPIARSLGAWFYYYAEDPNVSIADADLFLDLHADWPAVSRISRHVEQRLTDATPVDQVLALFETRDPLTGRGKLHLARALMASGRKDAAQVQLKDGWVNFSFTLQDEKKLLARYGAWLKPEDHAARVDRLLWGRQVTNARRVFPYLDSIKRRQATTRANLLVQAGSAAAQYDAMNESDRKDSGVMHAAVRHFRRKGEEARAIAIARNAPPSPTILRNASRWWDERQLLMRWAIREKRYEDAYAMASGHGLEPSTKFSEAEFNAGWLALRYLGAPDRAAVHFKALIANVTAPISRARGFYWLGRATQAKGDIDLARFYYEKASKYVYTFYGQLAAEKIGGAAVAQPFGETPPPSTEDVVQFSSRPLARALQMLSELDHDRGFLIFAYHLDDRLDTPGEYLQLAELANGENAPHITVRAGKVAVRRDAFAPEVSYPLIYVPDEAKSFAPAEVILGISRQESEFNPRAFSHAGARGMMQLIPSTAQITAKKEGFAYSRAALLNDPTYNMLLGSAHLSHLFERFNGSWIMTFAAYNAGPHRVKRWIEDYGDPRDPNVDPIDWAESIPFSETRNYVQRVLENAQIYRSRFEQAAIPGKLAADLERGGSNGRAGAIPGASRVAVSLAPLPPRTQQFADAASFLPNDADLLFNEPQTDGTIPRPQTGSPTGSPTLAPANEGASDAASDDDQGAGAAARPIDPATAPRRRNKERARGRNNQRARSTERTQNRQEAAATPPTNPVQAKAEEITRAEKVSSDDLNAMQRSIMADIAEPSHEANTTAQQPAPAAAAPQAVIMAPLTAIDGGIEANLGTAQPAGAHKATTQPASASNANNTQNAAPQPQAFNASKNTSENASKAEACAYHDYIISTQQEEASASDLNSAALAALKGGGKGC